MFKSQTRASESATQAGAELSRSRVSEDELSINTDIMTISGSNGQEPAPNFSGLFGASGVHRSVSGDLTSTEIDTGAPPPDYSSVSSPPAPASTSSGSTVEDAGDEIAPPPHYASVRFLSAAPDLVHSTLTPLPPPPNDRTAPPSYELPEPPSYDSLFNSSNA